MRREEMSEHKKILENVKTNQQLNGIIDFFQTDGINGIME